MFSTDSTANACTLRAYSVISKMFSPVAGLQPATAARSITGITVANIYHPHQRRLHSRWFGEGRHRHNFAQFEHVDAEQLGFIFVQRGAKTEQQQFKTVGLGQVRPVINIFLEIIHSTLKRNAGL